MISKLFILLAFIPQFLDHCNSITPKDKLKVIAYGMITVLSNCNHTSKRQDSSSTIKCLKLKFSYPILTPDLQLVNFPDSQYIAYFQGYTVHKFPYSHIYTEDMINDRGEVTEDSVVLTRIKNRYLVYKDGESFDHAYDSVASREKTIVKVDSFLASVFRIHKELLLVKTDLFVQKNTLDDNDFSEKYIRPIKTNEHDPDTICLFFSPRYNHYKYSLPPKLDSIKQAKLTGITFFYNAKNGNKNDIESYSREVIVQLKETSIEEVEEVREIIEKVKNLNTP